MGFVISGCGLIAAGNKAYMWGRFETIVESKVQIFGVQEYTCLGNQEWHWCHAFGHKTIARILREKLLQPIWIRSSMDKLAGLACIEFSSIW